MWHLSHEGSDLEDPWNAPKDELFIVTNIPEKLPINRNMLNWNTLKAYL